MIGIKYTLLRDFEVGGSKRIHTTSRKRIIVNIKGDTWKHAHLRASYYRDGVHVGDNDGNYATIPDILRALDAFSEVDIVRPV